MLSRSSLLGVLAVLVLTVGSAANPPKISDFFAFNPVQSVSLSPDGKKLLAFVVGPDHFYYSITEVGVEDSVSSVQLPDGITPLWIDWANNDRILLAFVAGEFKITRRRIEWPAARIVAMDLDGSNIVTLFENQRRVQRRNINLSRLVDHLPQDPDHILMPAARSSSLDLWKVNVNTGEAERVARGSSSTFDWDVDRNGKPNFRFDTNARGTVLRIFSPNENGRWRRIATVRDKDLSKFRPLAPSEHPGRAYVIARPEGADRAAVYLYDYVHGEYAQMVDSHPRVDIEGIYIQPATSEYMGYFAYADYFEVHARNDDLRNHIDGIREYFENRVSFSIRSMSSDGRKWLILVTAPNDPGAFYIYHQDEMRIEFVMNVNPKLTSQGMANAEIVRFTARDGMEISGYLYRPPHRIDPVPLIMMPHGGPEARDVFDFNQTAQFLATRGYAVFQPNFRGSSGFGRAFAEAGYGEWGGKMQNDITDAAQHLINMGVTEQGRMCIYGASYGGYAALAAAAFTPDVFECAISVAGVTDLHELVAHERREGEPEEFEYVTKSIGHPREDRDRLIATSPARHANSIKIPVLLIHGDEDQIVPISQSNLMYEALKNNNADIEYTIIEGEGHSNWSAENINREYVLIYDFLEKHLPVYDF